MFYFLTMSNFNLFLLLTLSVVLLLYMSKCHLQKIKLLLFGKKTSVCVLHNRR